MNPMHGFWNAGWAWPALFGLFAGLVGYLMGWLAGGRNGADTPGHWRRGSVFPGLLLILIGLFFLIDRNFYSLDLGDIIRHYWPLILILLGVGMLLRRSRPGRTDDGWNGWHTSHEKGETNV